MSGLCALECISMYAVCICVVYYVLSVCVVLVIMRLIWAKLSWVESEWLALLQKNTLELEPERRLLCVYVYVIVNL